MDWGAISGWVKEFGNIIALVVGLLGLGTTGYIAILRRDNKKIQRSLWETEKKLKDSRSEYASQKEALETSEAVSNRFKEARKVAHGEELSLWGKPPGTRIPDYDERMRNSIPIVLFANLKGGVAKTTLSANIGAYFAKKRDERVLLIDLDYQGSLSGLCLSQAQMTDFPSLTDELIDGTANGAQALKYTNSVGTAAPDLHFISAFYPLETTEFQIMFKWFLGDTEQDIRYNLASVLLSDEVQDRYDRIILDGPPRMTPALVNALCASTDLFIPTVLDKLSADTVSNFARKLRKLRGPVMPHLNVAGIIGTMAPLPQLGDLAQAAANTADEEVRKALNGHNYFMWDAFLRKSTKISNTTDTGIAYLQDSQTHDLFDPIGAEIAKRVPRKTS